MTVSGPDKGYDQRKHHLQAVHQTTLSQVGPSRGEKIAAGHRASKASAKNGTANMQRALQRAKAYDGQHDHDLRHCASNGLFGAFKKTWFCAKCFGHATSRILAESRREPADTWTLMKARWWAKIPMGTRKKIQKVAG